MLGSAASPRRAPVGLAVCLSRLRSYCWGGGGAGGAGRQAAGGNRQAVPGLLVSSFSLAFPLRPLPAPPPQQMGRKKGVQASQQCAPLHGELCPYCFLLSLPNHGFLAGGSLFAGFGAPVDGSLCAFYRAICPCVCVCLCSIDLSWVSSGPETDGVLWFFAPFLYPSFFLFISFFFLSFFLFFFW